MPPTLLMNATGLTMTQRLACAKNNCFVISVGGKSAHLGQETSCSVDGDNTYLQSAHCNRCGTSAATIQAAKYSRLAVNHKKWPVTVIIKVYYDPSWRFVLYIIIRDGAATSAALWLRTRLRLALRLSPHVVPRRQDDDVR